MSFKYGIYIFMCMSTTKGNFNSFVSHSWGSIKMEVGENDITVGILYSDVQNVS